MNTCPVLKALTDHSVKGTHRKEFCSYWIRHGECDYSQQGKQTNMNFVFRRWHANRTAKGCLFKHEMPTDISMLDKLGLRDIPRWYREKYQVESLLHPNGQTNRAQPANAAQKAITYPSNTQQSNTQQSNQPTPPPPTAPDNHGPANNTSNNIARGPNNRYKAQRGPGFAGPKARGNTHWYGKNGQRINLNSASRVANNAPVRGSDSPVSESSKSFADNRSTSSKLEQVTEDPKAATTAPFVSSPLTTVPPSAWIPRQGFGANDIVPRRSTSVQRDGALRHTDPFMNVNDVFSQRGGPQGIIGRRRSEELSARQTHLDNGLLDDGHGVPLNSGNNDLFNIKSRHFYSFGCDGDSQNASATGIATGDLLDTTTEMANVSTTDTYVPQKSLGQLIQNSEPILPSDLLLNFGPVGEHVQIPPFHQCTKTGALLGPATDYVPRP